MVRKTTPRKRAARRAAPEVLDQEDETIESEAFRDALLNGDEKINRLVKLIDNRFEASARRQRATRNEVRDLRRDLAPVIFIGKAWPYVLGALGAISIALGVLERLGLLG